VLGLSCCRGDRPLPQFFARSLSSPGARINVAYRAQPLLSFRECREITHVQAEPLASLLETATDEKAEALEFGLFRIRQGHWRRRRAQIEHERTRRALRFGLFSGIAPFGARCRLRRWCHRNLLPRTDPINRPPCAQEDFLNGKECERSRHLRDRGSPAVIGALPLDRWLCVPVFRRVCLSLRTPSVKASRMTVKHLNCVGPLKGRLHIYGDRDMLNCLDTATLPRPKGARRGA